jgi:outer membrane protein OmpA-like peptidoglycan-associated protein
MQTDMKIKMTKTILNPGVIAAILLAASLGLPAVAQSNSGAQVQTGASANATANSASNPNDSTTYATGKPLQQQSKEGFWGHVNPFARKKWVERQTGPIKDRLNELDQLSARNANDIKDVDSRAQAGIHHAQSTADQASQQAADAGTRAGQAQQVAQTATDKTTQLNTTVSNLDQYQQVSDTEIHFRPGQTTLNAKAKDALDGIATQLQGQKGYVVEVQGYAHARGTAGIQASQRMADAVVRYLVTQHQIPVYRIHQLAMGNAPIQSTDSSAPAPKGSMVHVTLMHNSLAAVNSSSTNGGSPIGATQQSSAQPSPQGVASQPSAQQQ